MSLGDDRDLWAQWVAIHGKNDDRFVTERKLNNMQAKEQLARVHRMAKRKEAYDFCSLLFDAFNGPFMSEELRNIPLEPDGEDILRRMVYHTERVFVTGMIDEQDKEFLNHLNQLNQK